MAAAAGGSEGVNVDDYNQRAIGALEQAQARARVRSAAAFAHRLAERGGGSPDASTYQRWLRGDPLAPAWALVAAAEEADAGVDGLLGLAGDDRIAQLEERMSQLEEALRAGSGGPSLTGDWLNDIEEQAAPIARSWTRRRRRSGGARSGRLRISRLATSAPGGGRVP